jgi:hypothetical protein
MLLFRNKKSVPVAIYLRKAYAYGGFSRDKTQYFSLIEYHRYSSLVMQFRHCSQYCEMQKARTAGLE